MLIYLLPVNASRNWAVITYVWKSWVSHNTRDLEDVLSNSTAYLNSFPVHGFRLPPHREAEDIYSLDILSGWIKMECIICENRIEDGELLIETTHGITHQ